MSPEELWPKPLPTEPLFAWGIIQRTPEGKATLVHIGLYPSEEALWDTFLGWGDEEDLRTAREAGYSSLLLHVTAGTGSIDIKISVEE